MLTSGGAIGLTPFPALLLFLLAVFLYAIVVSLLRMSTASTWKKVAKKFNGEIKLKNFTTPELIHGHIEDRPFVIETATSNEDDAPYHHTRGALPISNPATLIAGLRHKSWREEFQTRKSEDLQFVDHPEFSRMFLSITNDQETLSRLLSLQMQTSLLKYNDVEIYIHADEIEWKRYGLVNDYRCLTTLTDLIYQLAVEIDALPFAPIMSSTRDQREALISKGV